VIIFAASLLAVVAAAPASAERRPPDAPAHWLPNEEWSNLLWLPFEEERLYRLLDMDRGEIFRWIRNDADHTLAQLGEQRGYTADGLARALVAPRRDDVSPQTYRLLVRYTRRVLTFGHLSQHLLFHSLHQRAIPRDATEIFGVRRELDFLSLRRAELSPVRIGDLHGRTRAEIHRAAARTLREAASLGVRRGFVTDRQRDLLLDRQLRQLPRWLDQGRYNGPSGGRNAPDLPPGDMARHPTISADGSLVTWDAYRRDRSRAEREGEIYVVGHDLDSGRRDVVSPRVRPGSKRPHSSYNAVLAAGGGAIAFEQAASTFPLAKRVGQMSVLVRDLAGGGVQRASHAGRPEAAPTRTAFNPALSADGRIVAFEATDAGRDGAPSRNGLWTSDRATGRQVLVAEQGDSGGAYLPALSGDGSAVAFSETGGAADTTQVWMHSLADGTRTLVSRSDGPGGEPANRDAGEPTVSRDGTIVAFASRAGNLGGEGRTSRIYVRDLAANTVDVITPEVRGDAVSPAMSPDGRFIAYVVRRRGPVGSLSGLRSRIWLHDRATATRTVISRRSGERGTPGDGYASEPAVSADGGRVVFTTTAGNLSSGKPGGLAGVFVRDLATHRTTLLSSHAAGRGTSGPPGAPADPQLWRAVLSSMAVFSP